MPLPESINRDYTSGMEVASQDLDDLQRAVVDLHVFRGRRKVQSILGRGGFTLGATDVVAEATASGQRWHLAPECHNGEVITGVTFYVNKVNTGAAEFNLIVLNQAGIVVAATPVTSTATGNLAISVPLAAPHTLVQREYVIGYFEAGANGDSITSAEFHVGPPNSL